MWSNDGMLYCDICGKAIKWRNGEKSYTMMKKTIHGNQEELHYCKECKILNEAIIERGRK